jgi:hypothetical protein
MSGNFIIRNMSNNSKLKRLHIERMARLGKAVRAEKNEKEPFECPVCYSDGAEFGLASPACGHQVCLSCYSNILLRTNDESKCPCCRKPYFKPAINPAVAEADPYYGLPPLISAEEANYHWFTSITTTTTTTTNNLITISIVASKPTTKQTTTATTTIAITKKNNKQQQQQQQTSQTDNNKQQTTNNNSNNNSNNNNNMTIMTTTFGCNCFAF